MIGQITEYNGIPLDEQIRNGQLSSKSDKVVRKRLVRYSNRIITCDQISIDCTVYKRGDIISDKDWMNLLKAIINNSVFGYIIGNENKTDNVILIRTSPRFSIEIYRDTDDNQSTLFMRSSLSIPPIPKYIRTSDKYRQVLCKEIIVDDSHYTRGNLIDYKTCEIIVNCCLNTPYYAICGDKFTTISTMPSLDISSPSYLTRLPFINYENITNCISFVTGDYIHYFERFCDNTQS